MASVDDVAAAIISEHPGLDQMQLHKLLYFVQAASLVWQDTPAFDVEIEAWTWGPVTRVIAGRYMQFDKRPIRDPVAGDSKHLDSELRQTIKKVVERYGDLSGPTLAKLTKAPESPWRQVRRGLPDDAWSDREIPRSLIRRYHRQHGVLGTRLTPTEKRLAQRYLENRDTEALADLFEEATGARPQISSELKRASK
ncbi:MAG: type II toxin-antitoxin system antitoxin SocA domain-containing protein [Actinomycetota bacterium]